MGALHTQQNEWTLKDSLVAILVVVLWGFNFVPMKTALQYLTPFELGAWRFLFAVVPMCFFMALPKVRWRWLLMSGMLQGFGQFSLMFVSLEVGMTAALASVLAQTQIYFTAFGSFLIFKSRPSVLLWISMATAAIGLIFYGYSAVSTGGEVTMWGILLMLGAAAMWSGANMVARMVAKESSDYNPLAYIVWSSLPAALSFMLVVALTSPTAGKWVQWQTYQDITPMLWLSFMYLGWASTIVAYGLWTRLLKRHDANKVAPFSLGVPITGMLAGIWILGETVDRWQWIGTAFIGLSLLIVMFAPKWIKRWVK